MHNRTDPRRAPTRRPGRPAREAEFEGDPSELVLAFAPLHKRAFGVALGTVLGAAVFLATLGAAALPDDRAWPLALLSQYFAGYTVSVRGAVVGLAWGGFVGFVAGWFMAFCRNLALALQLWLGRTRQELHETRDLLDHI